MKSFRKQTGPFKQQPYFTDSEIEHICVDELSRMGLFPSQPEPIRIDRFIEKRFKVSPTYQDLPEGVLGITKFTDVGVAEVIVAKFLEDEEDEHRIRTTLAHEAGHGLLHSYLFVLDYNEEPLFGDNSEAKKPKVLCRENSGQWWEFQANKAMGALLMPRSLTTQAAAPLLTASGSLGIKTLTEDKREEAARYLAGIFNVNPVVAHIRLSQMYPVNTQQMTL